MQKISHEQMHLASHRTQALVLFGQLLFQRCQVLLQGILMSPEFTAAKHSSKQVNLETNTEISQPMYYLGIVITAHHTVSLFNA